MASASADFLKCQLCELECSTLVALKEHTDTVHKKKDANNKIKWCCHLCPTSVKSRSLLISHLEEKHLNRGFNCRICSQRFFVMQDLIHHR